MFFFRNLRDNYSGHDSTIIQHLLGNQNSAAKYVNDSFIFLYRPQNLQHLRLLEAVPIKLHQASMDKRKEHLIRYLCLLGGHE